MRYLQLTTTVFLLLHLCCLTLTAQDFLPPEDLAFISKVDGTEQRFILLRPTDLSAIDKVDLMVALHGHGSDRWQFARDMRDECIGARQMAAENRMLYVCPDYRAKTSWMGPAATSDVLQLLDQLEAQFKIGRVLLCGGSMGGTSALAFAAMHPQRVHGVVSLNGTANMLEYAGFAEAIAQSFGATKGANPDVYRVRSAELFSERFTFPVAVTTGGRDELVPPTSTLRLIDKLKAQHTPCLSIHRPDGGHSTNLQDTRAAIQFVLDYW